MMSDACGTMVVTKEAWETLQAENKRLCFRIATLEGARDIARQEQAAAERARDRANAEIVRLEDRLSAAEEALGNPRR